MSFVVKTRDVEVPFVVELEFEGTVVRERVVSGPDRENGLETLSVRVYGGP